MCSHACFGVNILKFLQVSHVPQLISSNSQPLHDCLYSLLCDVCDPTTDGRSCLFISGYKTGGGPADSVLLYRMLFFLLQPPIKIKLKPIKNPATIKISISSSISSPFRHGCRFFRRKYHITFCGYAQCTHCELTAVM